MLVFEPGTSAGSAYIVPFAQWLVARLPGWQVWSVERRQNLLEDQSVLTAAKEGRASAQAVFDYYLGWLQNGAIRRHLQIPAASSVAFAKGWGLNVAMQDLHLVIAKARRLGGHVVLAGPSLGGALITANATWSFAGRPGASDLAGLVFDDGAAFGPPSTAAKASADLAALEALAASPWGGVGTGPRSKGGPATPAPRLGLFSTTGALAAIEAPNAPSLGTSLLPAALKPPVPLTNLALFAFNTDVHTSVLGRSDFAILAHEGRGITARAVNGVHGWDARGALTPPSRWAAMLSGPQVAGADGVEWYFPYRLTMDIADALGNGLPNPAQSVLGVHATMGNQLPHRLLMYAFGAALGKGIVQSTAKLARQSHIPRRNLLLVNANPAYAHNDPAGAYPRNRFLAGLLRFLGEVDGRS